jgi:hypothetical protein
MTPNGFRVAGSFPDTTFCLVFSGFIGFSNGNGVASLKTALLAS